MHPKSAKGSDSLDLRIKSLEDQVQDLGNRFDRFISKFDSIFSSSIPDEPSTVVSTLEFIRTGPAQMQTLQDDYQKFIEDTKYHRKQTETSVSKFREDLDEFKVSTNPSLSSVLIHLTSVLKTLSIVQESVSNKAPTLYDPSCPSLVTCYTNYLQYKERNGSLSFLQILQKTPSILRIFLSKIHVTDPTFSFSTPLPDLTLLRILLDKVFYPDNFTVDGFQLLITANQMKTPITVQSAYEYALFIKDVTEALGDILPQAATPISKCWDIVRSGIDIKHELSYKLMSEHPHSYDRFYTSLESKIKSFFESSHPSISSSSPFYPPHTPRTPGYNSGVAFSNRNNASYPGGHNTTTQATYSGGSSIAPSSPPSNTRSVAVVSKHLLYPCPNCGTVGHDMFNCPKEFCLSCQRLDETNNDFFHRPKDCVLFDCHEMET